MKRLEEIKAKVNGLSVIEDISYAMLPEDVEKLQVIKLDDLKWLIQQAERAEQLEEENKWLNAIFKRSVDDKNYYLKRKDAWKKRTYKQYRQSQRYKQALEFYADEENHVDPFLYTREDSIPVHDESKVNEDGGKIARQALTGDEP